MLQLKQKKTEREKKTGSCKEMKTKKNNKKKNVQPVEPYATLSDCSVKKSLITPEQTLPNF